MKLVHFQYKGKNYWGKYVDESQTIITSLEGTVGLQTFEEVIEFFEEAELGDHLYTEQLSQMDVTLLAPVKPTKNILCIGKNYTEHILEFDGSDEDIERVKETPIFFSKALSSVTGPFSQVLRHEEVCDHVDYEAELAVVIGQKGINIRPEEAMDYVYGYTILNDVTSRDLQSKHQQWMKGKGLDTHCPIGPWVVTKDSLENPQNLKVKSLINGELRQNGNTNMMIHSIIQLIVALSKGMTLNPGDVIATGTPKGVGKGFNPPKYLKAGDEMEIIVEGIGSLVNTIV